MPMFHRRLAMLALLLCAGGSLPLLRACDLTIRKGDALREQAEARLVERKWIGTSRGRILDRRGTVLAMDRPSYDLEVDYPLISGQWAFAQAAREARRKNINWTQLNSVQREELVQQYLAVHEQRLSDAWAEVSRLTGVAPSEIEAKRAEIVERVSAQALAIWQSQRRATIDSLNRGKELSDDEPASDDAIVSLAEVSKPIREQKSPHVIVRGVSEDAAFLFPHESELKDSPLLPGMRLVDATSREYPNEDVAVSLDRSTFPGPLRSEKNIETVATGVATGIVGWMRGQLYKEDMERRPLRRTDEAGNVTIDRGGYLPGDSIGSAGLEASLESRLRGLRGSVTERLDTGEIIRVERTPGADVKLTLDTRLQARMQALMAPETGLTVVQPWQNNKALEPGTRLNAAAVVLDVETSEVLAVVSTPTFSRQQLRDNPDSVFKNEVDQPLLSRAFGRAYAPGSIVKPLVLAGAVQQGVWDASRTVACNGHFVPDKPDQMRCWIFKQNKTTHNVQFGHDLTADEAIMVSCNIYFFTLGQRLGADGMEKLFGSLGVGNGPEVRHTSLGIGYQFDGSIGRMKQRDTDGDGVGDTQPRITASEAVLMGIGQGPIAWTPLHAADAYATLARGGVRILPRIVSDEKPESEDLRWDPAAVRVAMRGLQRAVSEDRGTGHHVSYNTWDGVPVKEPTFTVPGLTFWGKSGTADSGKKSDDNPDASLDHSWFIVMAGPEGLGRPKVVVALLVEYGGSGGRVAGPLANQILWALRQEGHL